jgi:Phycobilisome Linker polypeptide.
MATRQLSYPLTTQNYRVSDQGGLTSQTQRTTNPSRDDRDTQIEQAYRQIFFHAMKCDRDVNLESQFRDGSITTRDFIRGLLLSRRFQEGYVACSSNYRLVDQLIGRVLGRSVHGESERISWSIVIAEQGFPAFIDALLDSDEYIEAFGYDNVPYQRSRVLPGAPTGLVPHSQRYPRYGSDWRDQQWKQGLQRQGDAQQALPAWMQKPPAWAKKFWLGLALVGSVEILRILVIVAGSMLSTR